MQWFITTFTIAYWNNRTKYTFLFFLFCQQNYKLGVSIISFLKVKNHLKPLICLQIIILVHTSFNALAANYAITRRLHSHPGCETTSYLVRTQSYKKNQLKIVAPVNVLNILKNILIRNETESHRNLVGSVLAY